MPRFDISILTRYVRAAKCMQEHLNNCAYDGFNIASFHTPLQQLASPSDNDITSSSSASSSSSISIDEELERHVLLEHYFAVPIPAANAVLRGAFDRVDIIGNYSNVDTEQDSAVTDSSSSADGSRDNGSVSSSRVVPQHVWVTDFKSNVGSKKPEHMAR
jgi:hypothetical protein